MKLLRGNPHFAAKPEFSPIRETGGRIDIYRGTVDKRGKNLLNRLVLGNDSLAVSGGVTRDMLRRGIYIVDDRNRHDIIQKLGVKIRIARRRSRNHLQRGRIEPQFDRRFSLSLPLFDQYFPQPRKKIRRDLPMHEAHLRSVADGRAACFGVFYNGKRHIEIRAFIDVNMTNAGTGFNAGNGRVFHTGADKSRAAARNQQID